MLYHSTWLGDLLIPIQHQGRGDVASSLINPLYQLSIRPIPKIYTVTHPTKSGIAKQYLTAKTGTMLNSGMVYCRGFMPENKFDNGAEKQKKHCPRRIEAMAT